LLMDREQLRAWLNALSAGDFSDLMTRVSLSSELTAFALAFGLPRADQTDSLLNFYAHSPREALAFLDMSVLDRLAELRD
ncbi:hypothetical protein, partial [Ralstonia pseudosolanacearum]|uniref:hypothetical protein n=1 Tax=Ralstonia pseudosolanacearum TaxID=1310165 RepID=UPI003CE77C83